MITEPVIVPTSGTSENRNAMKASRAVYSIGPMIKPSTVKKMKVRIPLVRPSST